MHGKSWEVGRIGSIPICIDLTWLLVLVPITASLALGYMPARYPSFSHVSAWAVSTSATCLLFLSVLGHELAHALIAKRSGIPVERISLFLFGGVAVLRREPATAWDEIKMAAAGPVLSLWVGVLLGIVYIALSGIWPASPPVALVEYLAIINLALAFFNLIPAYPLDGGRLLRATVWSVTGDFKRATRICSTLAQGLALLLIFWACLRMISGVAGGGTLSNSWVTSTWILLTGWFLGEAARAGSQGEICDPGEDDGQEQANQRLPGEDS